MRARPGAGPPAPLTLAPVTNKKAVGILRVALSLLAFVALAVGYDRDVHTGDAVNFFF